MVCPKIAYSQFSNPAKRCVYNADGGRKDYACKRRNFGHLKKYTLGNGVETTRTYTNYGSPLTIKTSKSGVNFVNASYNFNDTQGTLTSRNDLAGNSGTESFTYDNLRRLKNYGSSTVNYNNLGNITFKTDAGTLEYNISNRISNHTNFPSTFDPDMLTLTYNIDERPKTINKSGKTATFSYNHTGERTKMTVTGGSNPYTRIYLGGNYEREVSGNTTTERLYLGGTPYTAPAVAIRTGNGAWQLHYIHRDYLGSIVAITNSSTTTTPVETSSYDAWGRLRIPSTLQSFAYNAQPTLLLRRGYTGHEHLPEFGLINMNARLYDPVVGRFMSPDPYVQTPDFSQSFNRYIYCLNNPLIYTDPDGEWGWLAAGLGFVYGYVSYGLMNGNWGWGAVASGGLTGLMWGFGYTGEVAKGMSQLSYAGQSALSSTFNSFMPSISVPVGNNFTVNAGVGLGIGPNGLVAGSNFSGIYQNGNFSLTGGFGVSDNSASWGGGATFKGYGLSYYRTTYGNATGPDGKPNPQIVGGLGIHFNYNSIRIENDKWGDKKDRWRTGALEVNIGKWNGGLSVYTNDPEGEMLTNGGSIENYVKIPGRSIFWEKSKDGYGEWKNGQVYSSPLWIGYRNGNNILRIGYSHWIVQDFFQDGLHNWGPSPQHYYTQHDHFKYGGYLYSGYYNPFSLYN